MNEIKFNHLGIYVGKRKCRVVLKDDRGRILDKFFFGNNSDGISDLIKRIHNHRTKKCHAVCESTGNLWMRKHDILEDNGIDIILTNKYNTNKYIQNKDNSTVKIKSDKLDALILSDLLRTGLIYESYVPLKELETKGVLSDTG